MAPIDLTEDQDAPATANPVAQAFRVGRERAIIRLLEAHFTDGPETVSFMLFSLFFNIFHRFQAHSFGPFHAT